MAQDNAAEDNTVFDRKIWTIPRFMYLETFWRGWNINVVLGLEMIFQSCQFQWHNGNPYYPT